MREPLGVMENFRIVTWVVVKWVYTNGNISHAIHLRLVYFTISKLYLKKKKSKWAV